MTDEKLALLELITYIDSNVMEAADINVALLPILVKKHTEELD
ncbi:hypothetical protein SAMN04487831_10985 [Pseudobutyrivibrio sp. UC1225]|nr:hypothetical protein [Pseudobutyrivibrio sp. UC1225]SFO14198.1 hypothetical protein SAMN04487831_10985 [Pseudobutyrivibrio sp. UC1225]